MNFFWHLAYFWLKGVFLLLLWFFHIVNLLFVIISFWSPLEIPPIEFNQIKLLLLAFVVLIILPSLLIIIVIIIIKWNIFYLWMLNNAAASSLLWSCPCIGAFIFFREKCRIKGAFSLLIFSYLFLYWLLFELGSLLPRN